MYQTVNEPIEVLAIFAGGQIKPLSFRWRHRLYKIQKVAKTWKAPAGKYQRRHFGIIDVADNFFELCFWEENFSWTIAQTWAESHY